MVLTGNTIVDVCIIIAVLIIIVVVIKYIIAPLLFVGGLELLIPNAILTATNTPPITI